MHFFRCVLHGFLLLYLLVCVLVTCVHILEIIGQYLFCLIIVCCHVTVFITDLLYLSWSNVYVSYISIKLFWLPLKVSSIAFDDHPGHVIPTWLLCSWLTYILYSSCQMDTSSIYPTNHFFSSYMFLIHPLSIWISYCFASLAFS